MSEPQVSHAEFHHNVRSRTAGRRASHDFPEKSGEIHLIPRGLQQRLLAGEVVVEGHRLYAQLLSQSTHGQPLQAALVEKLDGRGDDTFS